MKLNVNGVEQEIDSGEDTPLLWVLRDHLGLTGTKYGCGKGLCGACTIHLDGNPVRSCLTTLGSAKGASIKTIEGLSRNCDHPVQVAWKERQVPQCGYCQAGQIMSAAALLESNPEPTDADIDRAMAGNICRCGTYPRIRVAIKDAGQNLQRGEKS